MGPAIPIAIGAGLTAAGMFGKKKKVSTPDYTPLINEIKAGAQRQKGIATSVRPQTTQMGEQYKKDIGASTEASQAEARKSSSQFLQDIGKSTQVQGQQLSDILRSRTLGAQPELQKQLREQMAATGGLQRGAAVKGAQQLQGQAAQQIAQGEQEIALQQQNAINQAKTQAQNLDQQLISDKLGIDKDTLMKLYDTGRMDLINEASSLLGIEQTAGQNITSLMGAQISANQASEIASAQNRQALLDSLTGLGTGMMTYGLSNIGKGSTTPKTSTPYMSPKLSLEDWNDLQGRA